MTIFALSITVLGICIAGAIAEVIDLLCREHRHRHRSVHPQPCDEVQARIYKERRRNDRF